MKKRIIGIDIARALAVLGMIIVNFKIVFGGEGNAVVKAFAKAFEGKAAATFVVLAGVGLALLSNSAVRNNDAAKLKRARNRIWKRALFLFFVGLSYIVIWPADILHFYGIYMLFVLLLLSQNAARILWAAVALVLLYPVMMMFIPYEAGWDFQTLEYEGFWTFSGFFRNLLYNGFHPVFPWAAFMLIGLWLGRQDLRDKAFLKKTFLISTAVFILIQLLSFFTIQGLPEGQDEGIRLLVSTSPMPPLPIYMFNGCSIAIAVITGCILLTSGLEENPIANALVKTGQMALTFYVAHVVLGMGLIEVFYPGSLGQYSVSFSVGYAMVFSLLCILFAVVWSRFRKMGPLEWLMRKITG